MATNPLIALQANVGDPTAGFSNALINLNRLDSIMQRREEQPERNRILAAQAAQQESLVPSQEAQFAQQERDRIMSVGIGAQQIIPDLQAGRLDEVKTKLQARKANLIAQGFPEERLIDTNIALDLVETDPGQLLTKAQEAVELASTINPAGGASARAFAPQTDPDTGQVFSVVFDPQSQTFRREVIPGARQLTPAEKTMEAIAETGGKENVKLREKRASDLRAGMAQRNRDAARSERTLNQALTLAENASQGLSGTAQLQLSRLIPGIDSSDEAALDTTLKQLALEQLQSFKGPTTDFEFGVAQSIAGGLGQSQLANRARLNSLKRATWFNKREFDQFDKHIKSGGDPDTFRFNFGEPIKTRKGVFTLQDIQDTAVDNNLSIEETIKRLNQ